MVSTKSGSSDTQDSENAPVASPLSLENRAPIDNLSKATFEARSSQFEVDSLRIQMRDLNLQLEAALIRETAHLAKIDNLQEAIADQGASPAASALNARIFQLIREKDAYRAAKQDADLTVSELRMSLKEVSRRLEIMQESPLYLLKTAIATPTKSWRYFLGLPIVLFSIHRQWLAGLNAKAVQGSQSIASKVASEYARVVDEALSVADQAGIEAAMKWLGGQNLRKSINARVLISLAKHISKEQPSMAITLAKQALELDPTQSRTKSLAFTMMDAGAYLEAADVLRATIAGGATINATEMRRVDEVFALERLHQQGITLPPARRLATHRQEKRGQCLLMFATQSVPYHWSAAAMRTHGAAQSAEAAGWKVVVATPPGYPAKSGGKGTDHAVEEVYGITYCRLPAVSASKTVLDVYASLVAPLLARVAVEFQCTIVQAPTELPLLYSALIAAHTAELLLVVDCDKSAMPNTSAEPLNLRGSLEARMVSFADGVIVRNTELGQTLGSSGIAADRIQVLPDVAPDFRDDVDSPAWRQDPALANRLVIGYVGDPDDDLDLEMLPRLLDRLVSLGHDAALAIFGVGTRFHRIKSQVELLGHAGRSLFVGRPRYELIADAYKCIDVVVVPSVRANPSNKAQFAIIDAQRNARPLVIAGSAGSEAMAGRGMITTSDLDDVARAVIELSELARARDHFQSDGDFFTPKGRAEALQEFYRSLVDRTRTSQG